MYRSSSSPSSKFPPPAWPEFPDGAPPSIPPSGNLKFCPNPRLCCKVWLKKEQIINYFEDILAENLKKWRISTQLKSCLFTVLPKHFVFSDILIWNRSSGKSHSFLKMPFGNFSYLISSIVNIHCGSLKFRENRNKILFFVKLIQILIFDFEFEELFISRLRFQINILLFETTL